MIKGAALEGHSFALSPLNDVLNAMSEGRAQKVY